MKKFLLSTFVFFIVLSSFNLNAQSIFGSFPKMQIDTARMYPYYRSCNKKEMKLLKKGDSLVIAREYKKALRVLRKLERKNSGTYLFKKIGDVNTLNKQYGVAEKYYNKAIKQDKEYKAAYLCKIAIYELQKEKEAIRNVLTEMKEAFPDDISVIYYLLAFHISNKEYENVILNITDLIKIGNQEIEDENKYSLAFNELADIITSINKKDIENSPELAEYLVHLLMKNRICYSCKIRGIVKKYPENIIAAKLYIAQDKYCHKNKTSLNLLKMLEDKGVATEWQYWRFGISAAIKKDWESAKNYYNKGIEKNDKLAWLFQNRGEVKSMLYDYNGAIEDMTKAISITDNNARFYIRRGNVYRKLRKGDKSLSDYIKASELDGGFRAYSLICTEYMLQREYKNALLYAEKAIMKKPTSKDGYWYKARACQWLKDDDKAIECLGIILSIDKGDFMAIRGLANLYLDKKDFAQALSVVRDAENNVKDKDRLLLFKSDIYIRKGDIEKSFECMTKIIANNQRQQTGHNSIKDRVFHKMGLLYNRCKEPELKKKIRAFMNKEGRGSATLFMEKARIAERNREYKKAVALYDKALIGLSGFERKLAVMNRLMCLKRYMSVPYMLKEYDKLIKECPGEDYVLKKAEFLFRNGMSKEGMAIVKEQMKDKRNINFFKAYRMYFMHLKDISECEREYKLMLKKIGRSEFKRGRVYYIEGDSVMVYNMILNAYKKHEYHKKALNIIDTLDMIQKRTALFRKTRFSHYDFDRAMIYKKMGARKKWFDLKYRDYINNPREIILNRLMSECLSWGMFSEVKMLLTKYGKNNKKYEHYCWLDIYPLMKAYKYKEAKKKFKEIVSRYSKNHQMLDMIYCDLLDACNGLDRKVYKVFLQSLNAEILTPMRNKGYKF